MAATRPRFWGLLPSPEGRSGEVLCLWSTGEERLGAEQSDGKGQAPAMPGGGELRAPWVPTARSRVAQSLAGGGGIAPAPRSLAPEHPLSRYPVSAEHPLSRYPVFPGNPRPAPSDVVYLPLW